MAPHVKKIALLLVACMLALSAFSAAVAQDAPDDPPAVEQDAKEALGERALPPDLSTDDPPAGILQADNAGIANYVGPTETGETVTETPKAQAVSLSGPPMKPMPVRLRQGRIPGSPDVLHGTVGRSVPSMQGRSGTTTMRAASARRYAATPVWPGPATGAP